MNAISHFANILLRRTSFCENLSALAAALQKNYPSWSNTGVFMILSRRTPFCNSLETVSVPSNF